MGQDSAHKEGTKGRVPRARELGWDDSLYEGDGTGQDGTDHGRRPRGRGGAGPGPAPGRPFRRSRWRILRWAAAVLSLLILGTAGAGYLYYRHLNGNIRGGERSNGSAEPKKPAANAAGQTPLNILLIGSDSRNKPENVQLGGGRGNVGSKPLADVQMLVHISADRENASVVSIPRDTRVNIPRCVDKKTGETFPATNAIINETLGRGGPGCTLSTWQDITGVYIDHWITLDFSGVVAMADKIGNVDVCVKQGVWDRSTPAVHGGSGLRLTAGTHAVKGEQALQWLRTRHAWGSDKERAKAQHMYLNSMLRTLTTGHVFTNPLKLNGLAQTATKSLEVSDEVRSVKKLFDLAMQLKSVPSNRITMTTMPTVEDTQNQNHLLPSTTDAETMWSMLRQDVPFDSHGTEDTTVKKVAEPVSKDPAAPAADTEVTVRNGTGGTGKTPVSGRAAAVAGLLGGKGYSHARTDPLPSPQAETTVSFAGKDLEGDAKGVATSLGIPLSSVKLSTDATGIMVVVGADWRTGTVYPRQVRPVAGAIPKSADAINGSDKNACMDVYGPYVWPDQS